AAATAAVLGIVSAATTTGSAGTGRRAVCVVSLSVSGWSGRGESNARREVAQQGQGDNAAAQGKDQELSEPSPQAHGGANGFPRRGAGENFPLPPQPLSPEAGARGGKIAAAARPTTRFSKVQCTRQESGVKSHLPA